MHPDMVSPKKGVYLTQTIIGDKVYRSITNIGTRPTVTNDVISTAETHIIDFRGNLYGKEIKLLFYEFMRPEQKFDSIETLVNTVLENIQYARRAGI